MVTNDVEARFRISPVTEAIVTDGGITLVRNGVAFGGMTHSQAVDWAYKDGHSAALKQALRHHPTWGGPLGPGWIVDVDVADAWDGMRARVDRLHEERPDQQWEIASLDVLTGAPVPTGYGLRTAMLHWHAETGGRAAEVLVWTGSGKWRRRRRVVVDDRDPTLVPEHNRWVVFFGGRLR